MIELTEERTKRLKGKSVESLFRTLSRNNYRLQQMVDRKANILISVNTIIITVLLSTKLYENSLELPKIGINVMYLTSTLSLFFALLSVRPFVVSSKTIKVEKPRLLNIIAIMELDFKDYMKRMTETIHDDNFVYQSMSEDIYLIGKNIQRKHNILSVSVVFIFFGILVSSYYLITH